MKIFISRHAPAVTREEHPERPLSAVGRAKAERMAAFAAAAGMEVKAAFHSGKLRAEQTARIYAETLPGEIEVKEITGLDSDDDPAMLDDLLDGLDAPVLLVGHLPHLEHFVEYLTTGDGDAGFLNIGAASLICLEREPGRKNWRMAWYVEPSLLP